ncbi:MAG TPA: aspartate aminotransferase family protein [Acidobacteriaceae bacterium]|nr:aspartate aminotransferase family protein [Acidobacteriaceae bacterium]
MPAIEEKAPPARERVNAGLQAYTDHVNPEWVRLLDLLGMNVRYRRCEGVELHAEDGRIFLDFLSGYCVHNTGHNHPEIVEALKRELDLAGPAMLQSHVADTAGELAGRLTALAGGRLTKAFFCSSGSEGVESVIKFARAATGRDGIVYARGAFHGLTCGALSLMGDSFWREGFGPMLAGTYEVPFNDTAALAAVLKQEKIAAVVLEPIQGEAGMVVPSHDYLAAVQELCRKHGALLVLDEVQTGLGRTGRFLASQRWDVSPDMVVLAKALSGGLVPVGAVLMTDAIYDAVYGSLRRAIIHTSTYSENGLAMRAGLATLDVLEREELAERSEVLGRTLRAQLEEVLSPYEMVAEVRGLGLFNGIVFQPPRQLRLKLGFEAFRTVHPGMFGQMLVRRLFHHHRILSQICGNNFMVLKVAPPLVVSGDQLDCYVEAIATVVDALHTSSAFWSDALDLGKRVLRV